MPSKRIGSLRLTVISTVFFPTMRLNVYCARLSFFSALPTSLPAKVSLNAFMLPTASMSMRSGRSSLLPPARS